MLTRKRGFTLIELLVVIAIIGILAAMLFPVFARARESARKIQCLSNVKNIALAMQMYLTDYDALWPSGSDAVALTFFADGPGGGGTCSASSSRPQNANPYLRPQVVLDEYIRNRDIWNCPSAKYMQSANFICPVGRDGYWLNNYIDHPAGTTWGHGLQRSGGDTGPCEEVYPPGWGGAMTDSFTQGPLPTDAARFSGSYNGVFTFSIGTQGTYDIKDSSIDDPAQYVVVQEVGLIARPWDADLAAFPETCRTGCFCGIPSSCNGADWANCPGTDQCGVGSGTDLLDFWNSPERYNKAARHLGGDNLGFADGHAKWYPAMQLVQGAVDGTLTGWSCGSGGTPGKCVGNY